MPFAKLEVCRGALSPMAAASNLVPQGGLFQTPSLRNVALRKVFFHNGVFHSLGDVLDWYVNRDPHPDRFYARDASGRVNKFDDIPAVQGQRRYPPIRHPGDRPALSRTEIRDVIAFLRTLTDGYSQERR